MTSPAPELGSMAVARLLLSALAGAGVRHLLVSPGSRSAPMAYAAAEAEAAGWLTVHVRIDERDAGFTALGIALARREPVAVAMTSGTAVGELLPAVMEANHAGIPLVVLSADRPTELHGTGANQTTRQAALFGAHVRAAVVIEAGTDPRAVLAEPLAALVGGAVGGRSRGPHAAAAGVRAAPGPVQINVEFRDPLVPDASDVSAVVGAPSPSPHSPGSLASGELSPISGAEAGDNSPLATSFAMAEAAGAAAGAAPDVPVAPVVARPTRTVVIAGHEAGPAAARFASERGLPLLAEPSSNARRGPTAIGPYRVLVARFAGHAAEGGNAPAEERIERVVVFGRPTLSRPVARLLADTSIPAALYVPEPVAWFEPGRRRERLVTSLDELAEFAGTAPEGWLESWRAAEDRAERAIEEALSAERGLAPGPKPVHESTAEPAADLARTSVAPGDALTGPDIARAVWQAAPSHLVIGSSNAVRDADLWAPPVSESSGGGPGRVYASRGLAGIDGTTAIATGIGVATGECTCLLVGDVTFLHDVGGLLLGAGEAEPRLDIVVMNDSGGAIFSTLEHGEVAERRGYAAAVERLFATPHRVDLQGLAAAYGLDYVRVETRVGLREALAAEPARPRRIIDAVLRRDGLRERERRIAAALR